MNSRENIVQLKENSESYLHSSVEEISDTQFKLDFKTARESFLLWGAAFSALFFLIMGFWALYYTFGSRNYISDVDFRPFFWVPLIPAVIMGVMGKNIDEHFLLNLEKKELVFVRKFFGRITKRTISAEQIDRIMPNAKYEFFIWSTPPFWMYYNTVLLKNGRFIPIGYQSEKDSLENLNTGCELLAGILGVNFTPGREAAQAVIKGKSAKGYKELVYLGKKSAVRRGLLHYFFLANIITLIIVVIGIVYVLVTG